jgi:host cell surface-exposed lipoprotein
MKKIYASIAILVTFTFGACAVPEDEPGTAADRADTKDAAKDKAKPKDDTGKPAKSEKAKPDAPKETAGEANARESAASYLDTMAFSRTGLIKQLTQFEGYSKADATYGVDAQKADWNEQAALSAKQYLDTMAFSRSGLIEQLTTFEGFTQEQATYGVDKVGL